MYSKEIKEYAIECMKKGYKYVTFDDCHVALWKIRPTYKRVHIGSNDDSCMASVCLWVNTDGKTDDYFGVAESDAAMFFSEHKDPTVMIKSLFEIASDGLSERMIDCIFDHMNVADMIDIKSVRGHISSFNVHDSYDVHAYMMYITIVTNRGAKPFHMLVTEDDPLCNDVRDVYYHITTDEKRFDITDIVKETLESKRISKNLYLKYFTDDEIEWILEHLDNYDDICGIWVKKVLTPHPNTDALVVTAFHSSSCVETKESIAISRLSCMFETLDYYTKYYITDSEIQKVIAKGIWYTKHAKD